MVSPNFEINLIRGTQNRCLIKKKFLISWWWRGTYSNAQTLSYFPFKLITSSAFNSRDLSSGIPFCIFLKTNVKDLVITEPSTNWYLWESFSPSYELYGLGPYWALCMDKLYTLKAVLKSHSLLHIAKGILKLNFGRSALHYSS